VHWAQAAGLPADADHPRRWRDRVAGPALRIPYCVEGPPQYVQRADRLWKLVPIDGPLTERSREDA